LDKCVTINNKTLPRLRNPESRTMGRRGKKVINPRILSGEPCLELDELKVMNYEL